MKDSFPSLSVILEASKEKNYVRSEISLPSLSIYLSTNIYNFDSNILKTKIINKNCFQASHTHPSFLFLRPNTPSGARYFF